MGIWSRLAVILKSYLGAASDRAERIAAEEELRLASARRKALEELRIPTDDLTSTIPSVTRTAAPSVPATLAADYRLLGVQPGAGLDAVEQAWRRLASRADPKRFPAASDEEKRAAELLKRITAAYARIREHINPTEGRFGRLEL